MRCKHDMTDTVTVTVDKHEHGHTCECKCERWRGCDMACYVHYVALHCAALRGFTLALCYVTSSWGVFHSLALCIVVLRCVALHCGAIQGIA